MANVQVPNLTPAISLDGSEQLSAVQAGTTVRVTTAQIAGLASSVPGSNILTTDNTKTVSNKTLDQTNTINGATVSNPIINLIVAADGSKRVSYGSFDSLIADTATYTVGTAAEIPSLGAVYQAVSGTGNLGQTNAGGQQWDVLLDVNGEAPFSAWAGPAIIGTDYQNQMTSAIQAVYALGGGTIVINDRYELHCNTSVGNDIDLLPRVSLRGANGSGQLVNPNTGTPASFGYGMMFRPGNLHPAYIGSFTFYAVTTPTYATRSLTFTNPSDAARFSVGDQVMIASTAIFGVSTIYSIPAYAWLNVVQSIIGSTVTFQYPIDVPGIALGVSRLASESVRDGKPAFFWQDASITDLEIYCGTWNWSGSDSATLNCKVNNCIITGWEVVYWNTFQRSAMCGNTMFFRKYIGETSFCSIYSVVSNNDISFIGDETDTSIGYGPSIQECARSISFVDNLIDFGGASNQTCVSRMQDTQACVFSRNTVIGRGTNGLSMIVMGQLKNSTLVSSGFQTFGNVVDGNLITISNFARFCLVNISLYSHGFIIQNNQINGGTPSANQALWIVSSDNTSNSTMSVIFEGNRANTGGGYYISPDPAAGDTGVGPSNTFTSAMGSFLPNGMINGLPSSSVSDGYVRNINLNGVSTNNLKSQKYGFDRLFVQQDWSSYTSGNTDFVMGPAFAPSSVARFEISISKQGATNAASIAISIINSIDGSAPTATTGGTVPISLPASPASTYILKGEAFLTSSGMFMFVNTLLPVSNTTQSMTYFISTANLPASPALKIATTTAGGDKLLLAYGKFWMDTPYMQFA